MITQKKNSMIIRRATPEDAPFVKKVQVETYQSCYRGYLPDDALDALVVNEDYIQRTAAYIQKTECWVAQTDNQIIGFSYITYPEPDTFEINALYIHPDFQLKGIGSMWVSELCAEKKEKGFQKLVVWTLKNGPSIGFYQKMGLTQIAEEEKIWKPYNLPIIRFEKKL